MVDRVPRTTHTSASSSLAPAKDKWNDPATTFEPLSRGKLKKCELQLPHLEFPTFEDPYMQCLYNYMTEIHQENMLLVEQLRDEVASLATIAHNDKIDNDEDKEVLHAKLDGLSMLVSPNV